MRITFFDLESTALNANWGRILCAAFAEWDDTDLENTSVDVFRRDRRPYRGDNLVDDSKLAIAIRDKLERSDIVVGWNSIMHDIPLLNARLRVIDEPPVKLGEKHATWHIDLMYYSTGSSMKIGGKSLRLISEFFGLPMKKLALDGDTWQLAAAGDSKALDLVVEHCIIDVKLTKGLWPYSSPGISKTSDG
ncbi:MAG: ribonuclease H-like domain-containing protein, partial [Halobacteria archaeon]